MNIPGVLLDLANPETLGQIGSLVWDAPPTLGCDYCEAYKDEKIRSVASISPTIEWWGMTCRLCGTERKHHLSLHPHKAVENLLHGPCSGWVPYSFTAAASEILAIRRSLED